MMDALPYALGLPLAAVGGVALLVMIFRLVREFFTVRREDPRIRHWVHANLTLERRNK